MMSGELLLVVAVSVGEEPAVAEVATGVADCGEELVIAVGVAVLVRWVSSGEEEPGVVVCGNGLVVAGRVVVSVMADVAADVAVTVGDGLDSLGEGG